MPGLFRRGIVALVIAAAAFPPRITSAQLPIPRLGIVGGVSQFDLSSRGTVPFGAVRIDLPLLPVILEGSVGAFQPDEQNVLRRTYIIPEAQLQVQLFPMFVRPYIGVGGGWVRAVSGPEPHLSEVTGSASAGVRLGFPVLPFTIRAELRVRGIGSQFTSSAAEWTIGISR